MQSRHYFLLARLVSLCFLILASVALGTTANGQDLQASKKILILFTHQSDQPAQAIVEQAMRNTLQSSLPVSPEIFFEYLDAVRSPLDDFEADLARQMQRKHGSRKFDLVFAVNPPALKFLAKHRASLFPGVPLVFLVLDRQNLSDIEVGPGMTGVWGEISYAANLELALTIHPQATRVIVLSGVGEWDTYWLSIVQDELRAFDGRIEISYLTGLTISEQKKALSELPLETIVLFVSSTRDREGNIPGNLEVLRQICPVSNAPVYGSNDAQLGLGIVGGKVLSFEALGKSGAEVGLRVLAGEDPNTIVPGGISSITMFDWRSLQRWNINENALPQGSIIKFKQLSFWDEYKWYAVGSIFLIVLEASLIGLLIYLQYRRRIAEAENQEISGRLINAHEDERARLARELHDDACQNLALLSVQLDLFSENDTNNGSGAKIKVLSERVFDLSEDLRRLSHQLHPARLQHLGLSTAIRSLCNEIESAHQLKIEFIGTDIPATLPAPDSLNIYRIIQEALQNVVKHSGATEASVRLSAVGDILKLTVEDTGCGFDRQKYDPDSSLGLISMRERVRLLRGRLSIDSAPNAGTRVKATIPIGGNRLRPNFSK